MRKEWFWLGVWALLMVIALFAAGNAWADCWACDSSLRCVSSASGGGWCFMTPQGCTSGGACPAGGAAPTEMPDEARAVTLITLLDTDPPAPAARTANVTRGIGRRLFGRPAARAVRTALDAPALEARVATGFVALGEGGAAEFLSRTGDGFALARRGDGRGARFLVRELVAGAPGRVLADERLDDNDALVVMVPFEGRARAVVIQPHWIGRLATRLQTDEWRREVRDAAGHARGREPLAVEVRPLES